MSGGPVLISHGDEKFCVGMIKGCTTLSNDPKDDVKCSDGVSRQELNGTATGVSDMIFKELKKLIGEEQGKKEMFLTVTLLLKKKI